MMMVEVPFVPPAPELSHDKRAKLRVAAQEGGSWIEIDIHSLQMPDGTEWDAHNGWRSPPGPYVIFTGSMAASTDALPLEGCTVEIISGK